MTENVRITAVSMGPGLSRGLILHLDFLQIYSETNFSGQHKGFTSVLIIICNWRLLPWIRSLSIVFAVVI